MHTCMNAVKFDGRYVDTQLCIYACFDGGVYNIMMGGHLLYKPTKIGEGSQRKSFPFLGVAVCNAWLTGRER